MSEPLRQLDNATVYYLDDHRADEPTRNEGVSAEIYPNWVRLRTPSDTWIPREMVEKVLTV